MRPSTRSQEGVRFVPVLSPGSPQANQPINGTALTLAGVDSEPTARSQHAEGRRLASLRAARMEEEELSCHRRRRLRLDRGGEERGRHPHPRRLNALMGRRRMGRAPARMHHRECRDAVSRLPDGSAIRVDRFRPQALKFFLGLRRAIGAFAGHHYRMTAPIPGGSSLAAHYRQAEKTLGRPIDPNRGEAVPPSFPTLGGRFGSSTRR